MIKPMLAATLTDINKIKFPVYVQPKLDGIRCLIINRQAVTRQLKPIPNKYIQNELSKINHSFDGEIMLKDPKATFQDIQSAVMTEEGEPDFIYYVFDEYKKIHEFEFRDIYVRLSIEEYYQETRIKKVPTIKINNIDELIFQEKIALILRYEGLMIRSPQGMYKYGRSTEKEGSLIKMKQFLDSEAEIIGFEEKMHNDNEKKKDALGYSKRSSHKANMVPTNTLGALIVRDLKTKVEFKIGTGFTESKREELWFIQDVILGTIINYKYQEVGVKNAPRFPVFSHFRDVRDL